MWTNILYYKTWLYNKYTGSIIIIIIIKFCSTKYWSTSYHGIKVLDMACCGRTRVHCTLVLPQHVMSWTFMPWHDVDQYFGLHNLIIIIIYFLYIWPYVYSSPATACHVMDLYTMIWHKWPALRKQVFFYYK